ncbi:tRNA adenosine(34) deaminase TadA [Amnibacterium endophyticum]|uniref:tRNA-specific adenosine deaminase n=1 Tax=Amnibacterium endophyticum TaxID=2109337 RepID=A0ABW4LFM3_9MICO
MEDRDAVRLALAQARLAAAEGEVPVGAVVLAPDGRVLGAGRNRREAQHDPLAHAEVVALREAARTAGDWRLDGCTLVATLEPCTMCAGALLESRVRRLVFGAWDEKAGAVGSVLDVLRDRRVGAAVEVVAGVLADECAAVLADFFAVRRASPGPTPSRG